MKGPGRSEGTAVRAPEALLVTATLAFGQTISELKGI